MRLRAQDEAELTAGDLSARFKPAPEAYAVPGCA